MVRDLPVLNTQRLVLRPMQLSDSAALHEWMSDPEVMRYWSTPPHADETITSRWVSESVTAMRKGEATEYVVLERNRMIGRVGLFDNRSIGYYFGRPHWNRGYATEALQAFIDLVFEGNEVKEIHADIDPRNAASLRLLERLGFTRTGYARRTIEVNGEWCDSVYLKLLAPGRNLKA
jgi:ribosomal-protein-alanine N-acetyltransferase